MGGSIFCGGSATCGRPVTFVGGPVTCGGQQLLWEAVTFVGTSNFSNVTKALCQGMTCEVQHR